MRSMAAKNWQEQRKTGDARRPQVESTGGGQSTGQSSSKEELGDKNGVGVWGEGNQTNLEA